MRNMLKLSIVILCIGITDFIFNDLSNVLPFIIEFNLSNILI